jgi:precorrin-6A/cobalt-precorrin-6A reductase
MRRILILGGTAEARRLAERLAPRRDLAVTLSLAGRTANPAAQAVPVRIGGFGGANGLAEYLAAERVDLLIDATHPYAAIMSANAAQAAAAAGIRLLALRRPPWTAVAGDRWIDVADVSAAAAALGREPRRVFLALGRKELAPFAAAPQHHYLIRSVDPVEPPLAVPHATYVTGRGPFAEADDRVLLAAHRIEIVVAKNSGGAATYSKIAAARGLGLAVVLLRRPPLPEVMAVESIEDAVHWIDHAALADREV